MIDILMPRLSDTMEEGAIATWHKKPGDPVAVGDVLVDIETDKATMEYEAYDAGILHDIIVPEGEQATIGMVIAHLDDGSSPHTRAPAPETTATEEPHTAPASASSPDSQRIIATPLVRRLARDHSLDLSQITGSGPGNRIIRADIDQVLRAHDVRPHGDENSTGNPQPPAGRTTSPAHSPQSTLVPFDKTRQVISRRLSESSLTTPHFSVTAVADVEALLALRAEINTQLESSERAKISLNDLLVRACAITLREHLQVNASYSAQGHGATLRHHQVNIGIAVAAPTGLVVPVVTQADQKSASHIAAESKRLTELARERKLTAADMTGGTFTISNLGMYGVEQFTAIINQPEGAILAVGAARPEPVVIDGALEVRRRMRYTLTADHRIIDGALAAQFLATLTTTLEHPLSIIA